MRKRWLSMALVLSMAASLTACGGKNTVQETKQSSTAETTAEEKKEETQDQEQTEAKGEGEAAGEPVTLSMWHIQTNAEDLTAKALLDAIALYEETHPNVKIVQDATQGEQYKVKIRTAAASDELPDIFFAWGYSFAEDFVKAGKALKMDSSVSPFRL